MCDSVKCSSSHGDQYDIRYESHIQINLDVAQMAFPNTIGGKEVTYAGASQNKIKDTGSINSDSKLTKKEGGLAVHDIYRVYINELSI